MNDAKAVYNPCRAAWRHRIRQCKAAISVTSVDAGWMGAIRASRSSSIYATSYLNYSSSLSAGGSGMTPVSSCKKEIKIEPMLVVRPQLARDIDAVRQALAGVDPSSRISGRKSPRGEPARPVADLDRPLSHGLPRPMPSSRLRAAVVVPAGRRANENCTSRTCRTDDRRQYRLAGG